MRNINLVKDFEDPYGSKLFKELDNLETKDLKLTETTRIDLVKEINKDNLPYIIFINRLNKNLFVKNLKLFKDNSEIKSAEIKTDQR